MPRYYEDISLRSDGDLSDVEFYSRMNELLDDQPRWVKLLVLSGLLFVLMIGAVIFIPLVVIEAIRNHGSNAGVSAPK